jgi:hypothetical protein
MSQSCSGYRVPKRDLQVRNTSKMRLRPGAGKMHLRPGAGKMHLRPGAGKMHLRPGAGKMRLRPGAGKMHLRPGAGKTHLRPGTGKTHFCRREQILARKLSELPTPIRIQRMKVALGGTDAMLADLEIALGAATKKHPADAVTLIEDIINMVAALLAAPVP